MPEVTAAPTTELGIVGVAGGLTSDGLSNCCCCLARWCMLDESLSLAEFKMDRELNSRLAYGLDVLKMGLSFYKIFSVMKKLISRKKWQSKIAVNRPIRSNLLQVNSNKNIKLILEATSKEGN